MKRIMLAFALVLSSLLLSKEASAQTQTNTGMMIYVEMSQLNVDNYPALVSKLKNNADFELVESCIPAKVVSVRVKNPNNRTVNALFTEFRNVVQSTGFQNVSLLQGYNDSQFLDKCKSARLGH